MMVELKAKKGIWNTEKKNKRIKNRTPTISIKTKMNALTCRWNASGIVKVDEIQQNVFTTCGGIPLTMHDIG